MKAQGRMRDSWWTLGEWSGQFGANLSTHQIECVFCGEKGNWSTEHHAVKRKPNGRKELNFDTLKCGNCGGYVMVLWSTAEYPGSQTLHDYHVLPWPLGFRGSDNWPEAVKRHWKQAHDNLKGENYEAAVVMARSALQAVTRSQGAEGRDLYGEIEDLSAKGILPNVIKEWSHEVRMLARPAAHPQPDEAETNPNDASDIVKFLDYLLEYVYDVPAAINKYRQRNQGSVDE